MREKIMDSFLKHFTAYEYLTHRYELDELPNLPLADEPFVREWEIWLENPNESPYDVRNMLSDTSTTSWLEQTSAGRIPVLYTKSRGAFERAINALYPGGSADAAKIPASVNAFTIKAKHPALTGHRVILLNRSGYSALSGKAVKKLGVEEDAWLEKSMTLRLNHEICHYFSLRVLGGMRNHVLDEIAADCVGQLAVFGTFKASLQRLFFGMSKMSQGELKILPGGRFSFYVKKLCGTSVDVVLEETDAALRSLESYLEKNPDMTLEHNRPRLLTKLLTTGISGMRGL